MMHWWQCAGKKEVESDLLNCGSMENSTSTIHLRVIVQAPLRHVVEFAHLGRLQQHTQLLYAGSAYASVNAMPEARTASRPAARHWPWRTNILCSRQKQPLVSRECKPGGCTDHKG